MKAKNLSTILNFLGFVFVGFGLIVLLISEPTARIGMAAVMLVSGSFLLSRFKRFDIWARTYGKWFEEKTDKLFRGTRRPFSDLGGRKVPSTILSLFGILILSQGIYITMTPVFTLLLPTAGIVLSIGVYLQVRFPAYIGDGKPKQSVASL